MTSSNPPYPLDADKPVGDYKELPPELRRIEAEAAAMEAPAAAELPPGQLVPVDYLAEARGVVDIAAEMLSMVGPRTAEALNQERRQKIADASAGLMEKYGLTVGDVFQKWGAEINFLFALAIVGPPVARAIKADRAEVDATAAAEKTAPRNPDPQPARPANDAYARAFPA